MKFRFPRAHHGVPLWRLSGTFGRLYASLSRCPSVLYPVPYRTEAAGIASKYRSTGTVRRTVRSARPTAEVPECTSTSGVMRWMDAAKILVLGRYASGLDNWTDMAASIAAI